MKYFSLLFAFALLCVSCQDEMEQISPTVVQGTNESGYAISADSALANLQTFLKDSEEYKTRSYNSFQVSSIIPVKYKSLDSRSTISGVDCENLLYIANFKQENGYAILAGDNRIGEKVIAITDEGSLSDRTVYTAIELENSQRELLEGYPATGPGFFTTPETGDELFINPNTVSLYDEVANDTYVGNFITNDTNLTSGSECINKPLQTSSHSLDTPEYITSSLCVSYAINEIKGFEEVEYVQPGINELNPIIDWKRDNKPQTRTETSYSAWNTKERSELLLDKFTNWVQRTPFNDLYPERKEYLFCGNIGKAPAGCFPLAIAKVLTHFETPKYFNYKNNPVDWKALKNSYTTPDGSTSAGRLLRGISSGCNSLYFYEGTFTFPSMATSYMRKIGIKNAHSYDYNFDLVVDMINTGCPLIIYSVPGINIFKSHCWNIDGYKVKERTESTKIYKENKLTSTTQKTESCQMVHCDFGWGGNCNGFYVSGIFNLSDSNIEHDPGTSYGKSVNYNNLLKVITYNKP